MKKILFVFFFLIAVSAAYSQELPASYPAALPVPPSSEYIKTETTENLGTVFYFESTLAPKEFYEAFKKEMKNKDFTANASADMLVSETGGMVNWEKDTTKVVLLLGVKETNRKTTIALAYK
jgi:hypothetical protein